MVKAIKVLKGLEILVKNNSDTDMSEEHDELFAGDIEGISAKDAKKLNDLGWTEHDEYECWCIFT